MAKEVESFRRAIEERDLEFAAPARRLYDLLLAPARAQLRGKTNLIIVPDDALWGLPFQALQPARDRYLLEDAALSYAPSLSVLYEIEKLRAKAAPAREATLLAFGNPALGEQTIARARTVLRSAAALEPLPEAETEVRTLAQLYGAPRSRVYTGAEAYERRIKQEAGNFSVLHFATHGVFNDASFVRLRRPLPDLPQHCDQVDQIIQRHRHAHIIKHRCQQVARSPQRTFFGQCVSGQNGVCIFQQACELFAGLPGGRLPTPHGIPSHPLARCGVPHSQPRLMREQIAQLILQ